MKPPGFQWYVAWRYLMARPRKASPVLVIMVMLHLVQCGLAFLQGGFAHDGFDPAFGRLHELSDRAATGLDYLVYAGVVGSAIGLLVTLRYIVRDRRLSTRVVLAGLGWLVASGLAATSLAGSNAENVAGFGQTMNVTGGVSAALAVFWLIMLVVRYYFTFFTTISIGGVFIGTMALVIVLSVMNGFEQDLRDKILGSNAHLLVQRTPVDVDGRRKKSPPFVEYRTVMGQIEQVSGVIGSSPYLTSEVVIGASSSYSNVIIKGVDPRTVAQVTDLQENLEEEDSLVRMWPLAPDGAIVGPPRGDDDGNGDGGDDGDADDGDDGGGNGGVDEAPDDMDLENDGPIDYSGGDEPPVYADTSDPAPDDLGVPDDDAPVDFSGGELPPIDPFADPFDDVFDDPEPVGSDPFPDWLERWPNAFRGSGFAGTRRYASSSPQVNVLDGVLVGRELVRNLHLYVGQEVSLVSPLGQMTPAGPAPKSKPYRVAGTFYTGMYEYDTKFIYVELSSLQRFLSKGDEVDGIEIRVTDPSETEGVKAGIAGRLGDDYIVKDWKEINRNLFSALQLEKIAMFLVLAIIILVASFSIVGNLIMVVVEKVREIALIKTLGASNEGIKRIFIIQGFFIGLVGTAIGVSAGLVACWFGKTYGLPLDPDVYYIDRLPIAVEGIAVAAVVAAGLSISVVATLYPAAMAARTRPAEGLRYE